MKFHVTDNQELKEYIITALKENEGYCPCIYNSKGKPEYKCQCVDFKTNVSIGDTCHCGLFIKDE